MPLKIKAVVDRASQEREREEERERAGAEHFKERGLSTPWKLAPVVANVADAVTATAMRRAGGKEKNPLVRGLVEKPLLNVPLKAALGAGSAYVADRIARKNKTAGKVVAALGTVPPTVGAASNVRAYVRAKKGKK